MIINVTRKHIRNGLRKSAGMCPVALAVKECTHIYDDYVAVTQDEIRIGDSCYYGEYVSYSNPPEVTHFIKEFDNRKYFRWWYIKPFSFELELKEK